MAEIWHADDYAGRRVVLDRKRRDHITERHDDMADRLDEVREVIEQADLVARDIQYRRRENHYRWLPAEKRWLKVVVNYRPVPPQGTWAGEVITAYKIKERDPEEEQLWP